jgi:hypothetical protein
MERKYVSSSLRRVSASSGDTVDLNQVFAGSGAGGGEEMRLVSEEWRATKSE